MIKPERYMAERLGALQIVKIEGQEIDLAEEVLIPRAADFEDLLHDQVARIMVWKRLAARAERVWRDAAEEYDELFNTRFTHYAKVMEENERAEMKSAVHDETTEKDDPFHRRRSATRRIAAGSTVERWRRNFTDDQVRSYVLSDAEVGNKRAEVRKLKNQFQVASGVVDALEHRMRCLSHLCALHRDASKHE